jgi:hypothetical protein
MFMKLQTLFQMRQIFVTGKPLMEKGLFPGRRAAGKNQGIKCGGKSRDLIENKAGQKFNLWFSRDVYEETDTYNRFLAMFMKMLALRRTEGGYASYAGHFRRRGGRGTGHFCRSEVVPAQLKVLRVRRGRDRKL